MNTEQWLEKILSDQSNLYHWLQRQYVGEVNAARRIKALLDRPDLDNPTRCLIEKIASDEAKHAKWVLGLLAIRGVEVPALDDAENRYWKPINEAMETFEDIAAAGHHAEGMRLVRIRALAACDRIDADIRDVFQRILPDEQFHERAFLAMSSQESLDKMKGSHEKGLELLGLEI